jgi:hypothetical protein
MNHLIAYILRLLLFVISQYRRLSKQHFLIYKEWSLPSSSSTSSFDGGMIKVM